MFIISNKMFSYILSFFNGLFAKKAEDQSDDEDKERFLAEQLLDLEILSNDEVNDLALQAITGVPRTAMCFQKSGVITYIDESNAYVLIDGMLYFDLSACSVTLHVNDIVMYLAYKDKNESVVIVRILENQGPSWGDVEEVEENNFKVIEHVIIGEVDYRREREVFMKDTDLKFSLDNVVASFVPVKGDWLELQCTVQWDENKPSDISAAQVLEVVSIKALRSQIKKAVITEWTGEYGSCDRNIYFDKQSLQTFIQPQIGSKVMVEAIESNQGVNCWRVIKMILIEPNNSFSESTVKSDEEADSLELEKEKKIQVTYPLQFVNVNLQETSKLEMVITNNSEQAHILNKWIVLSKKRDSQINIKPFIAKPIKLYPKQTFYFTISCHPKFLGNSKECFIIMFKGFQIRRFVGVSVVDNNISNIDKTEKYEVDYNKQLQNMRNIRKDNKSLLSGVRTLKPPNFVPVRLGAFPIPEKIWSAVLGDSNQTIYNSDFDKIIHRIEQQLPQVAQDLNIMNYVQKWHSLLYIEEIQANINMRVYDMQKVFLNHCQEYLCIEIIGLSERRPSLIKGDRALVTDIWNSNSPKYEGFIHTIKGDLVMMKFNPQFHENYSGSDVSLEFHFSRTIYRRAHQAISLALSNLGPDILFPTRILSRPPVVTQEKINEIKWYNENLNKEQKAAVCNILNGECKPMPYCIYGPPGTGKTITVIETILQILTVLPDSRILVAAPSNSAANLIAERLVKYNGKFTGSIIRLIANYLIDSETLPDNIKPFCATLDITKEETAKSHYERGKNGIHLQCRTSFIGRHRVTIGTCYCLGALAQMGLPKGHFTHIIIDEAGQATEPEIMIPMTFTDKDNGQIILAGDPMQLGPITLSKYCKEFGMDESYLSRILDTFPYQRDYAAYDNGFNNKLVTRLNDNYRSVEEVLKLPSQMFYDSSLVEKFDKTETWVNNMIDVVNEIFDISEKRSGGIFTYGIRGCNMRAQDSSSWYNPQEASMIALTTCKLYKKNLRADDIGIITPYIAQVKHLRLLFDAMGLPLPKIGTVEEFQGQERPIILISTVRSAENYINEDTKHTLGFVKNPKRLNVALTRAQVAVILYCNPHLLCKDPLWEKVISYSVKEDKYMGCDLPVIN